MWFQDLLRKAVDKTVVLEDRINRSTFGRVFRLDGSGHVSQPDPLELNNLVGP